MSCVVLLLAASDYFAVSQEVVFPARTMQRSVAIPIVEDSVLEAMEFFSVRVTVSASHTAVVILGVYAATISIIDDDSKWLHGSVRCLFFIEVVVNQWFLSRCNGWIFITCV